jgi:uncharacterized protein YprB with RNaseH-like and TPR domain
MRVKKRRLFFDIEVSPNVGIFWTAGFKQTISYESILKERAIICICYKWEGEKTVYSLTWDKKQCDKKLLQQFVKIAEEADELIGHNGDRFDITWIRTRCVFHKIPVTPFLKTIDTLKIAKRLFRFNSNRLDYLGKFLGMGCKITTGYGLWKKVLDKDDKALKEMVTYCKGDVNLLEGVFQRLANYEKPKTHYGVMNGRKKSSCPECGSDDTKIALTRVSAAGVKRVQLQCKKCGKYHTVSKTTLTHGR